MALYRSFPVTGGDELTLNTWHVRIRCDGTSRLVNSNPQNEHDARPVLKDRPGERFKVIQASGVCSVRQGLLQANPD